MGYPERVADLLAGICTTATPPDIWQQIKPIGDPVSLLGNSHVVRPLAPSARRADLAGFGESLLVSTRLPASRHRSLREGDRKIYNLGNSTGFSVRQVIESARRATGKAIKIIEAERRPGDPGVLVASSDKIRSELGWKPRHAELGSIGASAWEWMQRNPKG